VLGADDHDGINLERLTAREYAPDASPANCSSIVLLLEYDGRCCLLGADGSPSVLERSVERLLRERDTPKLPLAALKLPHHGSKYNVSGALLAAFDCSRYLVSSNGAIFGHPDREAVARVILTGGEQPSLLFNYRSKFNEVWDRDDLRDEHGYRTQYPPTGRAGLVVTL
jgi:beta-lactamase superfamily II metal-dependent hydrolase